MSSALASVVRVSVLSPKGRVDVSLPGGVAVAEVTAELATRLGLEPGLTLSTVLGDPLLPEATVGSQVRDGSVLQIAQDLSAERPVVYDDVCEAVSAVATSRDRDLECIGRAAVMVGCGLVFGVAFAVARVSAGASWSDDRPADRVLIGVLLLVGLTTLLLPNLALACARLRNGLDGRAVEEAVERGRSVLVMGSLCLGGVLVVLIPFAMAVGPAEALLAVNVALGFILSARALRHRPAGRTVGLGGSAAERFGVRMTWLEDGATWLTRFMLLPLSLGALGLIDGLLDRGPW